MINRWNSSPLKFNKVFDNSNFKHREMKYTTTSYPDKFRKKTDVVTEWKDCSCPNEHWGTYSVEEYQHFEGRTKQLKEFYMYFASQQVLNLCHTWSVMRFFKGCLPSFSYCINPKRSKFPGMFMIIHKRPLSTFSALVNPLGSTIKVELWLTIAFNNQDSSVLPKSTHFTKKAC